jgi:hypothetical protein
MSRVGALASRAFVRERGTFRKYGGAMRMSDALRLGMTRRPSTQCETLAWYRLSAEAYAAMLELCTILQSRRTSQAVANEPYVRRASSAGPSEGSRVSAAHMSAR